MRPIKVVSMALLISVILFSTITYAYENKVKIISSKGDVSVLPRRETDWIAAGIGMTLRKGDRVKTGFDSECSIIFDRKGEAIESDSPPDVPKISPLRFYCENIIGNRNIEITNDYYRNNLFYNTHNITGAKILNFDMENRKNPTIIEIGGGLGGGTKQFVIQKLQKNNSISNFEYIFTDVANKMLRITKKSLLNITQELNCFKFKKLDFNKNLADQGYAENSVDIIWGVNAAHVAIDLRFTLNEFYKTLKPNGSIILAETVRPIGNTMIQQELLLNTLDDYWNVKLDEKIRPRHGFMDWTDWVNALKTMGFSNVETIPDMRILQEQYNNCYIAVIRGKKQ